MRLHSLSLCFILPCTVLFRILYFVVTLSISLSLARYVYFVFVCLLKMFRRQFGKVSVRISGNSTAIVQQMLLEYFRNFIIICIW